MAERGMYCAVLLRMSQSNTYYLHLLIPQSKYAVSVHSANHVRPLPPPTVQTSVCTLSISESIPHLTPTSSTTSKSFPQRLPSASIPPLPGSFPGQIQLYVPPAYPRMTDEVPSLEGKHVDAGEDSSLIYPNSLPQRRTAYQNFVPSASRSVYILTIRHGELCRVVVEEFSLAGEEARRMSD